MDYSFVKSEKEWLHLKLYFGFFFYNNFLPTLYTTSRTHAAHIILLLFLLQFFRNKDGSLLLNVTPRFLAFCFHCIISSKRLSILSWTTSHGGIHNFFLNDWWFSHLILQLRMTDQIHFAQIYHAPKRIDCYVQGILNKTQWKNHLWCNI